MPYKNIILPLKFFKTKKELYRFLSRFTDLFCKIDDKNFRTFHFFIENCFENVCLEIRIDRLDVDNVISWIKSDLEDILSTEEIKMIDYEPEYLGYGDAWYIAEKIFEYNARASIYIRTEEPINLFRESKFIHCFLNQLGYDSLGESAFHSLESNQMLIKYFREKDRKSRDFERK